MTADATYYSGVVQNRQDGNEYVPSGKSINVESGGAITVESGGTLTVASGAVLVMAGHQTIAVEVGTTTAAFSNSGYTTFGSTASNAWTLAAPSRVGLVKTIACTVHGATTVTETVTTLGCKILGATTVVAGTSVMTFSGVQVVQLVSLSTASWGLNHPIPTANVAFS